MKYELLRCKDLKMRARTVLKAKIFHFFNVFSAGSMYFYILKTGVYMKFRSCIEYFYVHLAKPSGISEKMTPIVSSQSNINPASKANYF